MSNTQIAPRGANGQVMNTPNGYAFQSPPAVVATLTDLVKRNKTSLQQMMVAGTDPKRLYRAVVQCIMKNAQLAKCTPDSIMRAMMDAAEAGLEPGGAMNLAYLVPYGTECTYIISYRGLVNLVRRSGHVRSVEAQAVYRGDGLEFEFGLNPVLRHKPQSENREPGQLTHAYAIARFKDGSVQFDVMTRADIEAIRERSKAKNGGPWVTDYAEMAKKTVVRRLCKLLPQAIEIERVLSKIDAAENRGFNFSASPLPALAPAPNDEDLPADIATPFDEDEDIDAHGRPEEA